MNKLKKIIGYLLAPKRIVRHPWFIRTTWGRFRPLIRRYCPICQRGGPYFVTYGVADNMCPACSTQGRARLFWLYYEELLKNQDGTFRFLHFAPEWGLKVRLERMFGERYVTVDIRPDRAKVAADIMALPFQENEFDFILCSHVLEHISDDQKAMSELFRVLKLGGEAVIMVPLCGETTIEDPAVTDPQERHRLFGQSDHVRYYGRDIIVRLQSIGFSVAVVNPEDVIPSKQLRETLGIVTRHPMAPVQMFVAKKGDSEKSEFQRQRPMSKWGGGPQDG